jgi:hypothetical protein
MLPKTDKKPEDRLIVLCIAYHNIAVEQEFLKQVTSLTYFFSIKHRLTVMPRPPKVPQNTLAKDTQ